MLHRGSNTRGARGQQQNRSRGSRGRGSTSRGASNSSSEYYDSQIPTGPRALRDSSNTHSFRGGYRGKGPKNNYLRYERIGTSSTSDPPNPFEEERLQNAAKRERRGQNPTMAKARGGRQLPTPIQGKQVRFADEPADNQRDSFTESPVPAPRNPFETAVNPNSSSGSTATSSFNTFATKKDAPANPFGAPSTTSNPFGAPSQPSPLPPSKGIFGMPSQPQPNSHGATGLGKPSTSVFGMPSNTSSGKSLPNPFQKSPTRIFGTPPTVPPNTPPGALSKPNGSSGSSPSSSTFGASSNGVSSNLQKTSFGTPSSISPFGSARPSNASSNFGGDFPKPATNGAGRPKSVTQAKSLAPVPTPSSDNSKSRTSALGKKIDQLLQRQGLNAPTWPNSNPGDGQFRGLVEGYWRALRNYRTKVRACLIREGIIDDPDKPKKLSEAINFKGTCEDMCPEFEKATRIFERDVKSAEMGTSPAGTLWPDTNKMVKALARSSAGQDAPLPMDVRSPAALRRTLDYLIRSVLGDDDENLPRVHHFLWDRTRAIRRDFVFQSALSRDELLDQVYCLEHITRFHVVSLHQMSKMGVVPVEEFSEHQEVEQLGKALLSLIHAYEDCNAQNIECENEAEFRSYYVLFNSHSPGILKTVQDWGWKFWGESDDIRTAVTLVETLQNIWDTHGPVKPYSTMDTAQNAYARFFSVVEDRKVSYTMACFAEIHFNFVRKSILKTILASYRKQRDQTKDWTLSNLNQYLRFDDETDIVSFAEAYGLQFGEDDDDLYLSFESEGVSDPHPRLKQPYSYHLVERKRGSHSLPEVIDSTVYDEAEEEEVTHRDVVGAGEDDDEDEGLFVKDNLNEQQAKPQISYPSLAESEHGSEDRVDTALETSNQSSVVNQSIAKPLSLFDRISTPTPIGGGVFTPIAAEQSSPQAGDTPSSSFSAFAANSKPIFGKQADGPLLFSSHTEAKQPEPPSIFAKPPESSSTAFQKAEGHPLGPKQDNFASLFPKKQETEQVPPSEQPSSTRPSITQPGSLFNFSPQASPSVPVAQASSGQASFPVNSPVAAGAPEISKAPFSLGNPPVAAPTPVAEPSSQAGLPNKQTPSGRSLSSNTFAPDPAPLAPTVQIATQDTTQQTSTHLPEKYLSSPFEMHQPELVDTKLGTKQLPAPDRNAQLAKVTEWVALGTDGIIDQFTSYTVERILSRAAEIFTREEEQRAAKEEETLANEQADRFRYRSLGTKYFHIWREGAHRLRLKRRGREARQARKEMAESLRASRAAQSANIVEDFRASTSARRRGSLESLLEATGVLNGVHDPDTELQTIVRDEQGPRTKKRHRAQTTMNGRSPSENQHKRGKSDNPLRRSLLSDPSYLTGGSRIHLLPKYDIQDETRRQVSGVQTDYFRLKARGIVTLPNGTPLASSAVKGSLRQKQSFDGITKPNTPSKLRRLSPPRSVPSKSTRDLESDESGDPRDDHIHALKQRAQAVLSDDNRIRHKRSFDGDDEALFERAKRVREQMDEGVQWYRDEIERRSGSRSVS
ncbi:uncharacterized protein BP5553_07157 [Venustampulla echinocandica]|uniref:SAC3/GANP/THP3 conserved domain-containing protein n=1 Tax=Venustampulla echinocandica TaxID=2656787 RepID=A0A370TIN5_9HELO|nr:uncharacterized protein BP5553_07157 [Venustampulla echinocandica]RDL35226.1 hypothetical protein BP5553_07157 [Venustampulla echinocandica]